MSARPPFERFAPSRHAATHIGRAAARRACGTACSASASRVDQEERDAVVVAPCARDDQPIGGRRADHARASRLERPAVASCAARVRSRRGRSARRSRCARRRASCGRRRPRAAEFCCASLPPRAISGAPSTTSAGTARPPAPRRTPPSRPSGRPRRRRSRRAPAETGRPVSPISANCAHASALQPSAERRSSARSRSRSPSARKRRTESASSCCSSL